MAYARRSVFSQIVVSRMRNGELCTFHPCLHRPACVSLICEARSNRLRGEFNPLLGCTAARLQSESFVFTRESFCVCRVASGDDVLIGSSIRL